LRIIQILINVILLLYGTFVYGLQRLCYGQLRQNEIEQLYERAWFAVTETCLAMTIFREEVGAWFLVMFTALVTGKVWEWIGEGRVEVLEQQPPANPRLFHARLSVSLLIGIVYDIWLFTYAMNTVIMQARPNMMVMFLFEFAILTTCSLRTAVQYVLSLVEADIVASQTRKKLEERKKEARDRRADILRRRESGDAAEAEEAGREELPDEDDIDEMDIEVSGWEAKGQFILSLDLIAGEFLFQTRMKCPETDMADRLYQAGYLHSFLCHTHEILRPPDPHHAGSVHDDEIVHPPAQCLDQISQGRPRLGQIPGRNTGGAGD
jgi:E3 ubiquitin-protein ligase synoviolin